MKSLNRAELIGNLGQDPEIRYTKTGDAVATLSIATSESYKNKVGEKVEKTEWHRVVIFGKLADIAQQYLTKGAKVYLSGKLVTRKWQDNSGNDRYSTEIQLSQFEGQMIMLSGDQPGQQKQPQKPQPDPQAKPQQPEQQQPEHFDDDIPF